MNPFRTARSRRESRHRIEARLASLRHPEIDPALLQERLTRYCTPGPGPTLGQLRMAGQRRWTRGELCYRILLTRQGGIA